MVLLATLVGEWLSHRCFHNSCCAAAAAGLILLLRHLAILTFD
eukprot:COSAG06_NODE_58001_length_278_cov_0.871508_2_plen_42_part_01